MKFHRRCGDRVTLLHDNTTAVRNFVEFNHGLILSADPLPDDVIFEVCIDRKVNVWNGSLEIGVTTNDPEYMDLPATATKLRNTAWIMSGCSIVKDGVTLINEYGPELDSLHEGEILGVMKSSKGDLSFYINGRCLGVAAEDLPHRVFAVIDLYGQCVQVTIVSPNYRRLEDPSLESISESLDITEEGEPVTNDVTLPSTSQAPPQTFRQDVHLPLPADVEVAATVETTGTGLVNSEWQEGDQNRAHSVSSGSGDPDQDVMSDREDEDSREDRYDSIARGIRDPHLDSNVVLGRRENATGPRNRVGMLYDWHLDQLTPYTGDVNPSTQFDNSISEMSEAGLTSEESEAIVDEIRTAENRTIETMITMPDDDNDIVAHDRLRFHPRCGDLVKISPNYRSAERTRPLDDYNNGVVMTHRPLHSNELFEIRIDKLVDKWSGSVEMGVTHHNPTTIRYPSTMTNMESGTIMMSGCKVLLNGQGTSLEYGNVNLDELREGDRVGVVRKHTGQLHYVINGVDQGVAAEGVQTPVWGVVDLYGMTVQVSIQDTFNDSSPDSNINDRPLPVIPALEEEPDLSGATNSGPRIDEESLLFHTLRDSHVTIINNGTTAHRPNAFEYFHNGVVTTSRTLRTNELFQVRLDLVIPKWAGSIEIGVTQHSSSDLKFPYRVTNIKTGTWVLSGEDVFQNGNIIIPKYVRNLSRLKEGDTVGVVRKDGGILHFYVDGVDQGPAACNVPEHVFGIIDLYGRVAQATIVDSCRPPLPAPFSPESPGSTASNATVYPEMCFHRVHGRNARLSRTRLTASRTAVYSEFNDAVLFSSRPLRECDMFELRIDAMVDCWIGSLEIGVTAIRPEELETNGSIGSLAGTATDLNCDTYILSGAAMMKDGECVKSGYALDLDTLTVGSRVGMMWHADRHLHYYLDGMDMGKAWYVPHLNIYAVVDLYGQCTQVTILQNEERAFNYNGRSNSDSLISSNGIKNAITPHPPYWSFSEYCGDNVCLTQDLCVAKRLAADPMGGLVFSSAHLAIGEMFQVKILECSHNFAGNFRLGVTDVNILNAHVNRHMPPSANFLPHFTAYVDGRLIRYSKPGSREQELAAVVPSFEWLRAGDRVGLKKTAGRQVHIYVNGDQLDAVFENVPDKVYVVMELYGRTTKIQAVTKVPPVQPPEQPTNAEDLMSQSRLDIESEAIRELLNINPDGGDDELPMQLAVAEEASESDESDVAPLLDIDNRAQVHTEPEPPTSQTERPASEDLPMVFPVVQNARKRAYTFHDVHGQNIELLASETVARRRNGFNHGIAVISKPLLRGHSITFRVEALDALYSGTLAVGVVPYLPNSQTPLPPVALELPQPAWVVASEFVLQDTVSYYVRGLRLNALREGHAVVVAYEASGDVTVSVDHKGELDSEPVAVATFTGAGEYAELYPLVDLYGRVVQVSATIHTKYINVQQYLQPDVLTPRAGILDLALNAADARRLVSGRMRAPWPHCVYYEEGTAAPHRLAAAREVRLRLGLVAGQEVLLDLTKKYLSEMSLPAIKDAVPETSLKPFYAISSEADVILDVAELRRELEIHRRFLAEQRADSMLDVPEIKDTADEPPEPAEPPDRAGETAGPNVVTVPCSPTATHGYARIATDPEVYVCRIVFDGHEALDAGAAVEIASGEGCELARRVMHYWSYTRTAYPDLHRALGCGQVRCYCVQCAPDSCLPGWVRIERIEGVGSSARRYWHLTKRTLGGAAAVAALSPNVKTRPPALHHRPNKEMPSFDLWLDDEHRAHIITLVLEVDTESADPNHDRLLAILLYMRAASRRCDQAPEQ